MKNNVFVLDSFKREYKRLSKKYKSLYSDLANLISSLELNPFQGVLVGANVRSDNEINDLLSQNGFRE